MGERSFFVEPGTVRAQRAEIGGQVAHQIGRVLRLRPGDTIELMDNSGIVYVAKIDGISRESVSAEVLEQRDPGTEPPVRVDLYQALLKGQKMEWVLQKGTEIGVSRFVPMLSERCISRPSAADVEARLERWRAIVREAAEQSGRAVLPDVAGMASFEEACAAASRTALPIMAWEEERGTGLGRMLVEIGLGARAYGREAGGLRVALLIGPEGGFSRGEVDMALSAGMRIAGLGPRILRAETAALVAATVVLQETGGLGG
jgi:16S rRNA (uracil1498-N3)-methyltransferase